MPTLAQKTRVFNGMLPEAHRLGIFWARPHNSDFGTHDGADRQITRLRDEIAASGGDVPPVVDNTPPSKHDTWAGLAPEWRAERAARAQATTARRGKTPGQLRRDQLNAQRARLIGRDAECRRKIAEGVRASWTPERREAEREVGREKWARFGDRVTEGMLASWDSYTGRQTYPCRQLFDLNFTLEHLNAMTFEEVDPFEGWKDDGRPIPTLHDRLDALHRMMDAVLGT